MRIFAMLLLVMAVVFALLLFFYVFNYAITSIESATDQLLGNITEAMEVDISLEDLDVKGKLSPFITALNYVLIIGFLAAIMGIFLHARRRM